MDATTIARNIFQQDLIEARWITNSERNLLEPSLAYNFPLIFNKQFFLPQLSHNNF
uniref:Uncharacterized protein n=1 Tax=Meloidogyne incognita TaxID=6306 RepID=A0A914M226_MELIC